MTYSALLAAFWWTARQVPHQVVSPDLLVRFWQELSRDSRTQHPQHCEQCLSAEFLRLSGSLCILYHITIHKQRGSAIIEQDGHKIGEKHSDFSRAITLLFHTLLQQKVNVNNEFHQGSFHTNSSNITGHHRTLRRSMFLMILFTQSTAVLHKYLNVELKILCLLQFFPKVAQNSLRIPWVSHVQNSLSFSCSEKSPSIPRFPGLWPPCWSLHPHQTVSYIN